MAIFYTYLWLREDGTPYYVGKGTGLRAFRKGSPPKERILVQEFSSEQDAIASEIFLISYYGRLDLETGCLRNRTDGGEGLYGLIRTASHCEKIGNSLRGKFKSERACHNFSLVRKGAQIKPHSKEQNSRISASLKGKPKSLAHRRILSERTKLWWAKKKEFQCQNQSLMASA